MMLRQTQPFTQTVRHKLSAYSIAVFPKEFLINCYPQRDGFLSLASMVKYYSISDGPINQGFQYVSEFRYRAPRNDIVISIIDQG